MACKGRKRCTGRRGKWKPLTKAELKKSDRCHNRATAFAQGAEKRAERRAGPGGAVGEAWRREYNKQYDACMAGRRSKKR